MRNSTNFRGRPFFILAALTLLTTTAHAADTFNRSGQQVVIAQNEAPVRYGNSGGFAPTDLSNNGRDDMTGGVVASPLPAATSNSYQAQLETRLTDLENQMRDLRGQMEEKDHQITQLKTQLDKALADIDMRLNSGAAPAGAVGAATMPASNAGGSSTLQPGDMPPQPDAGVTDPNAPASANSPTTQNLGSLTTAQGGASIAPSSSDPAVQYESAFAKLKAGDYKTAQLEFDRFLKANPTNKLAANATYWYGETFYAQQKYQESARIFAESYKKYPQSPKAADSLLKLGMSLGGAGKTKEACVTLKQLKKQYATGNATTLKRADQELAKLSCS